MDKHLQTLDKRSSIFNNVQLCSVIDSCILTTPAFRLVEDFKSAIQEEPTSICDICWKFKFRRNVIKLNKSKCQTDIDNKCITGKSSWICKSCHNSLMKNKMLMQTQLNNMKLFPKFIDLNRLCRI